MLDRVGSLAVRFGVHTGLQNTTTDELVSLWHQIERYEFEWISIWDHFYAADATFGPDGTVTSGSQCLEAVAMHTALALSTERVRCGSLVYCVGYRHPAVLANAMASADLLSGGRVTVGLGAGWHQAEYAAYNLPFPPAPVRLRQVAEAIQCLRLLFTEDVANFEGEFFQLRDARCDPKPAQARLPLWLGGGGERVTLKLVARYADGWNVPFVVPEVYAHKVSVLREHCERAGRDPDDIEKTVNLALAWRDEDLEAQFGGIAQAVRPNVLIGSTQQVVDRVGEYADAGCTQVNLALRVPFDRDGLDRFATEVMPAFSSPVSSG
jgi:alkanesulfonate monooxygenase SsuD/methylene tetrahydromethanopterin reductase-like flavin-dependent oxidoreductase (luciferase family)